MTPILPRRHALPPRQRGATLLVAMIFLVVLMLVVASAVRVTTINTKLVGNMQTQQEATAAVQQAIEDTVSYDFTKLPQAQTIEVDINNSGQAGATYTVKVAKPQCLVVRPIKNADLDVGSASDRPCFASGAAINSGIIGSTPSGNSVCSDSMWNISASAIPSNSTQPAATLRQGVTQRVDPGANCS